jgi:hypothetical protein
MRRPSMLVAILVSLAVLTAASPASAMYHPTVGKWVQRDPDESAGTEDLYEYAWSSPARYLDCDGAKPGDAQIPPRHGYINPRAACKPLRHSLKGRAGADLRET